MCARQVLLTSYVPAIMNAEHTERRKINEKKGMHYLMF